MFIFDSMANQRSAGALLSHFAVFLVTFLLFNFFRRFYEIFSRYLQLAFLKQV